MDYRSRLSSFARSFTKRVDNEKTFSERLRRAVTNVIECTWRSGPEALELETVPLLNRLKISVDDVADKRKGRRLLISTIRSTAGRITRLSSHYWQSLDKLVSDSGLSGSLVSGNVEVVKLLEEAEDWERLEVWMVIL